MYENVCTLCEGQGKVRRYIGESSRSLWERNNNHQLDALNRAKLSHMRAHMAEAHPKEMRDILDVFRMTSIKKCSSAMQRQVREALEISADSTGKLLNLQEEYNRCILPSLFAKGPPSQTQQEHDQVIVPALTRQEEEAALGLARAGRRKKKVVGIQVGQYQGAQETQEELAPLAP